jgi:type I restriction enzyme S subunit
VKCEKAEKGTPVLRVPNIARGILDLSDLKYAGLPPKESEALAVQEGDLIVCRTNGSLDLIGKAAVIPPLPRQHAFASYLIRLRLDKAKLLPNYFHAFLSGPAGRDQIEKRARTTAGQFNLNLDILRTLQLPLPPLTEQHEIVRRVEALFRLADAIKKRVAAATARSEKLVQAILAKAFRGELVPTEAELARREGRDYEPASALLERIRAERGHSRPAPTANARRRVRRRREADPSPPSLFD